MTRIMFTPDSAEWLRWRRYGIGGSDAPIIMGVSPWTTPLELWLTKMGLVPEVEQNDAMRRGAAMEPIARAVYEAQTGQVVQPAYLIHPEHEWLRASLDGLSFDGDVATEIKCPGKSVHEEAKEGRVPDRYWPQIQHYLMVSGAEVLHYWSFDGVDGVLVPVEPDRHYHDDLFDKERAFWWYVVNGTPPEQPAYEGRVEYKDADILALAANYARLMADADRVKRELERAKARLTSICVGAVNKIGPLTISRCRGRTVLDQKALEAGGIDLAPYRKRGDDYWKIELSEENRDAPRSHKEVSNANG